MVLEVFLRKLEVFGSLQDGDRQFLQDVLSDITNISAHTTFVKEGDIPDHVHLVLRGWAYRFKLLESGRRQISAFIMPGDFCDLQAFILKAMDHSIGTLSEATVARLPRVSVLKMMERPGIAKALLFSTLVDESVLREWMSNIGQRSAVHRMAHLFCELYVRTRAILQTPDDSLAVPLTQAELGDSLGISLVHTNKSLQKLQSAQLVRFKSGRLTILDFHSLKAMCQFHPDYLHLEGGRVAIEQGI